MASYINKATQWLVKAEASYGVVPTFNYTTDGVEFVNPSMDGSTELIEREIIKNSLVAAKPVLGSKTSSGSLSVEVSAPASGAINGDVLYTSAMGIKLGAVAADTGASATIATVITATDGDLYAVGQGLKVEFSGSDAEYVVIQSISSDDLTVAPALTGTPANITQITGLITYVIAAPDTPTTSFSVREYMEAATAIEYTYAGCVVDSMTLNLPVGGIVTADFSVSGAEFSVASGVTDQAKVCRDLTPFIGKNFTFTYGGTAYAVSDVTVNVNNEVYDTMAITTEGITNKTVTGKSEVGGSFSLDYTGIDLFNVYQNGTTGALYALSPVADGAKFGVYAPNVMLSNVSKSVDNSIYRDGVDFRCLSAEACIDGVENTISVFIG